MKKILFFCLSSTSLISFNTLAVEPLPISGGINAGVTNVSYNGKEAVGYQWDIRLGYQINPYMTIYSGYGKATADIEDANGIDQSFESNTIPLAIQVNLPTLIGNAYVRGGGNYYENTFGTATDNGWGVLGAIGFRFGSQFVPGSAVEFSYRNAGDAETSTVSVGANISF